MTGTRVFRADETHGVLQRLQPSIDASSEGLGWTSVFASVQRERPFEARFAAVADCLLVLHRSGPVDVSFRSDGRFLRRTIPRGGIFLLPPGQACDVALHGDLDTTHIYLRAELLAGEDCGAGYAPLFGAQDPVLEHLAVAVGTAVSDGEAGSSLFIDPIAQAMANRLKLINGRGASRPEGAGGLSSRQLRRLREFVEANLEGDIRLDAMAKACGLATTHFVQAFKAAAGKPPYQYVLDVRVERARQLLGDPTQSLSEIALRCGFCNQEHLTRTFRRFTGQTPGRYRSSIN